MLKNVIVTGAAGFIGSSLIKRLISNDVNVVAIDISLDGKQLPMSDRIKFIECSSDNIADLYEMLADRKYDAFYHFAWQGVNGPDKANAIIQVKNISVMLGFAELAKKLECRKFLCAGTVAEQAVHSLERLTKTSGGMMYGAAKYSAHLMLETYCKNIGLDFVWMQFSNIYGPENKTGNLVSYIIEKLLNGDNAEIGPAQQPYDFIYIDDLIEAVMRLGSMETKENCYFIGSGEPRILKDYLIEIGDKIGRSDLIKIGARQDDGIVYSYNMFDTSKLVRDIGNYTSKSFSDGIKFTIENY